jgi:pimeloyl-ACP methyl ester carboxylesterase
MIPVSFASSFGWLHDANGNCGIVICPAQGVEDLCTHKSLRLMADAFAKQGYPALRFDYAGTGDSLGSDREPQRVEAWIASIEAAVEWLRANTKVDKVVLVGLRLGSALASIAADRLNTISGLILLAPIVSGRAYMRELSTLSNFIRKTEGPDKASLAADLEIAGFIFTPETVKDISAIDLKAFRAAPAPKVLVAAVESQASAARLCQSWTALGSEVERQIFHNYTEFMMDPAFSRFPAETMQQLLDWLATHFPSASNRVAKQYAAYQPQEEEYFSEYPVLFDVHRNLFGMMCIPDDLAYERPVVIYLNSGANHHIGWGRSTVEVCRKLAGLGLVSLRIDIGAIGDSPDPDPGQQVLYRKESTLDVSAAIDWLEAQGFHNVTVIGLCAGAHLGFHSALEDPRISRVIMVNLQVFLWRKTDSLVVAFNEAYQSTGFYLKRLFLPETWRRLSRGEIKTSGILRAVSARLRKKAIASFSFVSSQLGNHTSSEINTIREWMKALDRRKVAQHYIYSVGDAGLDELSLYRRIKGGQVKNAPFVSLDFIENADHNLSQHAARDTLVGLLQNILCADEEKATDSVSIPVVQSLEASALNP